VKGPTPCITGADTYSLVMDGQSILQSNLVSYKQALEAWFATFWIFSIAYPSRLVNSCTFLEKVILCRGGRVPSVVRKWSNRLKVPA